MTPKQINTLTSLILTEQTRVRAAARAASNAGHDEVAQRFYAQAAHLMKTERALQGAYDRDKDGVYEVFSEQYPYAIIGWRIGSREDGRGAMFPTREDALLYLTVHRRPTHRCEHPHMLLSDVGYECADCGEHFGLDWKTPR